MKEIFLINAYTDTIEKTDGLRFLIQNIKNNNYDICLITHTNTPQDIIDRCDYFIYDKQNPIVDDPEVQYWLYWDTPNFKINFVSNTAKIHFQAYYRLIFGGLQYLHTFGYDIVHSFDYDIKFNNFNEILNNKFLLNEYDIVAYIRDDNTKVTYFSVNLNNIDFKKMIYEKNNLFEKYKLFYQLGKYPLIENLLFDEFLPQKIFTKNISELEKTALINTERFINKDNYEICLFVDDNKLYIFIANSLSININVEVIADNLYKIFNIQHQQVNVFHLLDLTGGTNNIKIFVNDRIYLKYNLIKDLDYIKKYTKFNWK